MSRESWVLSNEKRNEKLNEKRNEKLNEKRNEK